MPGRPDVDVKFPVWSAEHAVLGFANTEQVVDCFQPAPIPVVWLDCIYRHENVDDRFRGQPWNFRRADVLDRDCLIAECCVEPSLLGGEALSPSWVELADHDLDRFTATYEDLIEICVVLGGHANDVTFESKASRLRQRLLPFRNDARGAAVRSLRAGEQLDSVTPRI